MEIDIYVVTGPTDIKNLPEKPPTCQHFIVKFTSSGGRLCKVYAMQI